MICIGNKYCCFMPWSSFEFELMEDGEKAHVLHIHHTCCYTMLLKLDAVNVEMCPRQHRVCISNPCGVHCICMFSSSKESSHFKYHICIIYPSNRQGKSDSALLMIPSCSSPSSYLLLSSFLHRMTRRSLKTGTFNPHWGYCLSRCAQMIFALAGSALLRCRCWFSNWFLKNTCNTFTYSISFSLSLLGDLWAMIRQHCYHSRHL